MVSYIPVVIWTAMILFSLHKQENDKDFITLLFLPLFIYPTIQVGSARISSLYYVCFLYMALVFLRRKRILSNTSAIYLGIAIFILLCFILGWGLSGVGGLLGSMIGFIKFIPIVLSLDLLLNQVKSEVLVQGFRSALNISVCIDFIAVLAQMINPNLAAKIIDMFFYNDQTINFSDEIIKGSLGGRMFGIFNHPSVQAIFCLVVFAFYLTQLKEKKINKYIFIISIFMGIASCSKTFVLGVPVVLAIWLLINFKRVSNPRVLVAIFFLLILCVFIVVNFDAIITYIRSINPVLAYYFGFLKKPFEALNTRYSMDNGNLSSMYSIIKNHLLFGVGPNSIMGEEVLDSAPLVLLHNGGIVCLLLYLSLFLWLFVQTLKYKQETLIYFLAIIFVSGFALPTWIFHAATITVTMYILLMINSIRSERPLKEGVLNV